MRPMKRLLCLLLCALMLLPTGCTAQDDPAAGDYVGVAVTGSSDALALADVYPAGLRLSLRKGGRAVMDSGENEMRGKWARAEDEALTLTFDDAALEGMLCNDMLSLVNPELPDLTFLLRRDDGTGLTVPLTAQTLAEAVGDSLGTADFVSPTKKLYVGMQLYGAIRFRDIVREDGTEETGEMYLDVWGLIDKDANGNTFLEVFTKEDYADSDPVLSLYILLAPDLVAPVIGKDNAWLGSSYLTPADAKNFAARLKNGSLSFSSPYTDPSGYTCNIDLILREKGTPWDLYGDSFSPMGITAEDIKAALSTK